VIRAVLDANTIASGATHPEDDLVLAAAVSAAADYLVTGDRQIRRLGSYQGVTIISPSDSLALLDQPADGDEEEPVTPPANERCAAPPGGLQRIGASTGS
jgi:hypothetical protein